MALVVEPTHPYTNEQLQLEDPKRWSRLFPLMRPSIKVLEATNGRSIVVDTAFASSKDVLLVAGGSVGNFSSRILSESDLAAFTTEQFDRPNVTAEDIATVLKNSGFPTENGVVIFRTGSHQNFTEKPGLIELVVADELKLDHVLSLLSAAKPEVKVSLDKVQILLEHFTLSVAQTTSKFHHEKTGKGPNVTHRALETTEFGSAKGAIEKDLKFLLKSTPTSEEDLIYSVHYSDINGLSRLETNILAHEISEYLEKQNLSSYITHSTILDTHSQARGWAISLCALPTRFIAAQEKPSNTLVSSATNTSSSNTQKGTSKIQFSDSQVRKIITAGCESLIKDEPTITEYDTIVGDGDCGYTLRDGATQVLKFISDVDLSTLPSTLSSLVDDLEVNMGGTSGALYCIFLSALSQHLWDAPKFTDALKGALEQLLRYTKAKLGDRTCLDCLIPFVETLQKTGDAKAALGDAEKGVESTKKLEATLGRSSYLDESTTRGVPDPGAYGLLRLLEGMVTVS